MRENANGKRGNVFNQCQARETCNHCQVQEGLKPVPSGGKFVENKIQMFSFSALARGALGLHERRKKIREYIEHENDDLCTD